MNPFISLDAELLNLNCTPLVGKYARRQAYAIVKLDNLFKYTDKEHLIHSLGVSDVSQHHIVKIFLGNLRKAKEKWALKFLQGRRENYDLMAKLLEQVDIAVARGLVNKQELLANFIVQQESLESEHVMRAKLTLYKALFF
jgi:hypothetical protein